MIPGITDRPRLPRLGKIRLGEKRTSTGSGKEYPAALDHFNFKDVPELEQIFGGACKSIAPIYIPLEEEDAWFVTSRAAYTKTAKFCQCHDGETATRVHVGFDEKTREPKDPQGWAFLKDHRADDEMPAVGEMFDLPCEGEECPWFKRSLCKNLGRLLFLVEKSPRFGVYEISTTSINSIRNVLSKARAIKNAAGRITGLPLELRLVPMEVAPEGKKKTVFVLDLDFRSEGGAVRRLMQARREPIGLLPSIDDAPETMPDDLYPQAGAKLEREVGVPAAAAAPAAVVDVPASAEEPPPLTDDDLPFGAEPVKGVPAPKPQERVAAATRKAANRANNPAAPPRRQSRPAPPPKEPAAEPGDLDFAKF